MAKTPGLLDLLALVPAADIARAAKALGLDPEALTKRLLALDSTGISTRLVDTATRALKPGEAGRLVIDHAARIFTQARDLTRDLEELAGLQAPETAFRHGHVRRGTAAGRGTGSHGVGQLALARARRDQRFRAPGARGAGGQARVRRRRTRRAPSGTRRGSPSSPWRSTGCSSSCGRDIRWSPPRNTRSRRSWCSRWCRRGCRSAWPCTSARTPHTRASTAKPATSRPA